MIAKGAKSDSRVPRAEVNHILQALPPKEYERLLPQLQPVPLMQGQVLFGVGAPSMCFHLSEIKVRAGQRVKKGQALGRVGSTGRATGPHLFFGVRWHDARINPQFLLDDPGKIPVVNRVSP